MYPIAERYAHVTADAAEASSPDTSIPDDGFTGASDAVRASVATHVESLSDDLVDFSRDLFEHPETGFQEERTVAALTALLRRHGAETEVGLWGLPTAFRARRTHGSGPRVAVLAEYDALPGIGHGCGHNVIAANAVGAFLALSTELAEGRLTGTIELIGTPAEEGGGGKEIILQNGGFAGLDAALMAHPGDADVGAMSGMVAKRQVVATFRGRTAHAAAAPYLGLNALDAAVTAYQAVAQLRQHVLPGDRVHGIFTDGGARPNVVPDRAQLEFFLRSRSLPDLRVLSERVEDALRGGAQASGVDVDVDWDDEPVYLPLRNNTLLAGRWAQALADRRPVAAVQPDRQAGGSTDMGNVSHVMPALHAGIAIGGPEIPGHSRERAESTQSADGRRAVLDGAIGLARTAADLLSDPALLDAVTREFTTVGPPQRVTDVFPSESHTS